MEIKNESVEEIDGVAERRGERLRESGIETVGDVLECNPSEIDQLSGLGESRAKKIRERAKDLVRENRSLSQWGLHWLITYFSFDVPPSWGSYVSAAGSAALGILLLIPVYIIHGEGSEYRAITKTRVLVAQNDTIPGPAILKRWRLDANTLLQPSGAVTGNYKLQRNCAPDEMPGCVPEYLILYTTNQLADASATIRTTVSRDSTIPPSQSQTGKAMSTQVKVDGPTYDVPLHFTSYDSLEVVGSSAATQAIVIAADTTGIGRFIRSTSPSKRSVSSEFVANLRLQSEEHWALSNFINEQQVEVSSDVEVQFAKFGGVEPAFMSGGYDTQKVRAITNPPPHSVQIKVNNSWSAERGGEVTAPTERFGEQFFFGYQEKTIRTPSSVDSSLVSDSIEGTFLIEPEVWIAYFCNLVTFEFILLGIRLFHRARYGYDP